jgi:hypothetical protein
MIDIGRVALRGFLIGHKSMLESMRSCQPSRARVGAGVLTCPGRAKLDGFLRRTK